MKALYPDLALKRVYCISREILEKYHIKGILLDVDNTLTTHDNPVPDENIRRWLDEMEACGMKMLIVSNNTAERVEPFAKELRLEYVANGAKPLTGGFSRAAQALGLRPCELAVVGDQIFTDILGGNCFGALTILVEPIQPEDHLFFKLKRALEVPILKSYRKKEEKRR